MTSAAATPDLPPPTAGLDLSGVVDPALKRKYRETLESHQQQMQTLSETQQIIMQELQS